MENQPQGGSGSPEQKNQRQALSIAGVEFSLEDALKQKGPGPLKRPDFKEAKDWKPGDDHAQRLLFWFQNCGVDYDLYQKAMPGLFEWSAKKEGGFDSDFLAVTERIFDITAAKMGLGESSGIDQVPFLEEKEKAVFFARAGGQIEAIREFIWDDPAMAGKKQQLVDVANRSRQARKAVLVA